MKMTLYILLITLSVAFTGTLLADTVKIDSANGDLAPSNGKSQDVSLSDLTKADSFVITCTIKNTNKQAVMLRADILPAAATYYLGDKSFHLQTKVAPGSHQLKLTATIMKEKLDKQPLVFSLTNMGKKKLQVSNCALNF